MELLLNAVNMQVKCWVWFLSAARGRLEGNRDGTATLLLGPVPPDPVLFPGCYSARAPVQRPRIGPDATRILERGQRGILGELLKIDSIPLTPVPKQSKCSWFSGVVFSEREFIRM